MAHRYYQFAMCIYKVWRYENGDDLIEQASNQQSIKRSMTRKDNEMKVDKLMTRRGALRESAQNDKTFTEAYIRREKS